MTDYVTYGIGVVGVVLLTMCYASIFIGRYIETLSTPKSGGLPWFSTPSSATKIASVIIMGLFIIGGVLVITSDDTVIRIAGVVSMISACMFEGTVLVFSAAVMSAIGKNKPTSLS